MNVAVFAPAGTVSDAGTLTYGELLWRLTDHPPVGAGDISVIVPVLG